MIRIKEGPKGNWHLILSQLIVLYKRNGVLNVENEILKLLAHFFEENRNREFSHSLNKILKHLDSTIEEDCYERFINYTQDNPMDITQFLAWHENDRVKLIQSLLTISQKLKIDRSEIDEFSVTLLPKKEFTLINRNNSLKAILFTFIVLLLIILSTLYLQPVVFGLILAYFCLPLHRFFYDSISKKKIVYKAFSAIFFPISFLKKMMFHNYSENEKKIEERKINSASWLTFATISSSIVLFLFVLIYTFPKNDDTKKGTEPIKLFSKFSEITHSIDMKLPALQEQMPFLKNAIEEARKYTSNPELVLEIINNKVFNSETANNANSALISIGGIISDLLIYSLLTLFFFSFFIGKIAKFLIVSKKDTGTMGNYIVKTSITSPWLPSISTSNRDRAVQIIDNIFDKIKYWAKSYIAIICLESLFYLIAFFIMDVPYFFILGLVAGSTILLPIIGPIASFLLTAIICFAAGKTLTFVLLIMGIYILMNMFIEQFLLYPKLVGKSLGLSVLETIIVVFLGSIIAGISGMIFSVPIASILKNIFPLLYTNNQG